MEHEITLMDFHREWTREYSGGAQKTAMSVGVCLSGHEHLLVGATDERMSLPSRQFVVWLSNCKPIQLMDLKDRRLSYLSDKNLKIPFVFRLDISHQLINGEELKAICSRASEES